MRRTRILVLLCVLGGCAHQAERPPKYTPPGEWRRPDSTQLREGAVSSASRRFSGSMDSAEQERPAAAVRPSADSRPASAVRRGAAPVITAPQRPASAGLEVVLGPIISESSGSPPTVHDAGNRVRELIAESLTSADKLVLHDAPEERFNNDSPRPDLARRGIRYVVKGVASRRGAQNEMSVFLRVVDTDSGKVAIVVSGRNQNADRAARDAAERLVKKLKGAK